MPCYAMPSYPTAFSTSFRRRRGARMVQACMTCLPLMCRIYLCCKGRRWPLSAAASIRQLHPNPWSPPPLTGLAVRLVTLAASAICRQTRRSGPGRHWSSSAGCSCSASWCVSLMQVDHASPTIALIALQYRVLCACICGADGRSARVTVAGSFVAEVQVPKWRSGNICDLNSRKKPQIFKSTYSCHRCTSLCA